MILKIYGRINPSQEEINEKTDIQSCESVADELIQLQICLGN